MYILTFECYYQRKLFAYILFVKQTARARIVDSKEIKKKQVKE